MKLLKFRQNENKSDFYFFSNSLLYVFEVCHVILKATVMEIT